MAHAAPKLRLRCRSYVIIPARLDSTRLPQKLLLRETGQSVLQHTYDAARKALKPLGVRIATDSEEIVAEAARFGARAELTSPDCASGTDRVAELARDMSGADIIVNVQGDEPEITGEAIDRVIDLLEENPDAVMATLCTPIRTREQLDDSACVKVAFDQRGRALGFSRSPIPCVSAWDDALLEADPPIFHQHLGIYAYRRRFLLDLAELPRTPLEKLENLEQLRVLEHGETILVGSIDHASVGIDTQADYQAFVARRKAG